MKRAEFELFISTLVNILSKMPIQRALQNDGLNLVAIDQNVLVGGSRRIPAVQALVEKILGKKSPNRLTWMKLLRFVLLYKPYY